MRIHAILVLTGASLLGAMGGVAGAFIGYCPQSIGYVDNCDWCQPWTQGTPPAGFWCSAFAVSCQGSGSCDDCCYGVYSQAGGPGAIGASVSTDDDFNHDDTPSSGNTYTGFLIVTSGCLETDNTYQCIEVSCQFVVGSNYGGIGACMRLDCKKCT